MFAHRFRLLFNFRSSSNLIRNRITRCKTRNVFTIKDNLYRLCDFKGNYSRQTLVIKVNNRCVFSNTNERKKEQNGLHARYLRSTTTMKLLLMASFCLVSDNFRSRRTNNVYRKDSPLSNANFNNRIDRSLLLTVMYLQSNKIRLIQTRQTSTLILRMSVYQYTRHFLRSVDTRRQDTTMMFMRFTSLFKSFGPHINLVRFLTTRFLNGSEVRIFYFRQLLNTKIGQ